MHALDLDATIFAQSMDDDMPEDERVLENDELAGDEEVDNEALDDLDEEDGFADDDDEDLAL